MIPEYRANGLNVTYSQLEQVYAAFTLALIGSHRTNLGTSWESMMEDASVLYGLAPIQGRDWADFMITNSADPHLGSKLAARLDQAINHFFGLSTADLRTRVLYLRLVSQMTAIWVDNLKLINMGGQSDLVDL